MAHHVVQDAAALQVAAPEPGRMRATVFLRGAREIGPARRCGSTTPGQGMAGFHLRREHLVFQVAVGESRALNQGEDALRFRDRPCQRLLAGDAAERPFAALDGIDDFLDVLDAPMVGSRQPERVDRGIGDHFANAGNRAVLSPTSSLRACSAAAAAFRAVGLQMPSTSASRTARNARK